MSVVVLSAPEVWRVWPEADPADVWELERSRAHALDAAGVAEAWAERREHADAWEDYPTDADPCRVVVERWDGVRFRLSLSTDFDPVFVALLDDGGPDDAA